MKWTVFEENIFNKALVQVGIYIITCTYNIIERYSLFNYNQRTYFLFAHAHTCQYNRHYICPFNCICFSSGDKSYHFTGTPLSLRTNSKQEVANLILKEDDKSQHTDTYQFIEDRSQ